MAPNEKFNLLNIGDGFLLYNTAAGVNLKIYTAETGTLSDHSKSAFYAQGLFEEKVFEQHKYVEELNGQLKPFKIFKSIKSDILNNGNLDYDEKVLASFDLVIASIHSNLKMPEEKAMMRLSRGQTGAFLCRSGPTPN